MRTLIPGLLCFLLACKLLLAPSSAQQLSFSHLGVNNGLSQGVNNCIYKDSRGFIWISSFDGLNRFDGLNCRIYRETGTDKISIKGTLFLNILEDKNSNLWIGSNQGLNCYERRSDRFVNYQMPGRAPADQFFSPFYIDDQNKVWLQSRSGIILFDPAAKQFTLLYTFPQIGNLLVKSKPALPYQSLQEIYVVVNNTPVINIATVKNNLFTWQPPVNISHPDITRVNYFLPDGRGTFWLATNDGLFYFNRTSQYLQPVLKNSEKLGNITVLNFDKRGRLWTGSQQQGLYLTDTASRKVLEQYYPDSRNTHGLSGQQVLYIHSDAQNYLWVAIWGKGIDYVSPDKFRFNHYLTRETAAEKGIDNFIRSIVQVAPNEIWVATQSSGILVLNEKKEFITSIRQSLPVAIEHLYKDSHANVWAATFNGLFIIDPLSRKVQRINNTTEKNNPPQNQFNFINQLQDGRMLASSNAGLFLISKKKNQYFFSRVKNCPANDVYLTSFQDSDGIIYISRAFKGFYTCRLLQDSLVAAHDYTYQASIKCFAETNDSLIWIGSTMGLMRYNKNQHRIQKIYTTGDGLSNQYIYAVLAHKEYLWLSTNAGLSRLNIYDNEVKNFSAADGLQSNEFNTYSFCKTTGLEMLFGGVNGLNAFYPDLVTPYKNKPQLQLATLQVNDTLYNPGINPGELESLGLQYKQNTISFQFTVLDYANAAAGKLLYTLEGYDKNKILASNKAVIRYVNLPAGAYTLRVSAINAEGIMSENEKVIQLTIAAPWWQQWWFRMLAGAGIVSLAFLIVRGYYTRKLEKQKTILEKQQAIEKERTRIATDMHDDFGASLSRIKFLSEKMKLQQGHQEKLKTDLEKISKYSDEMAEKMGEIVWALNQRFDSLDDLVSFCRSYATEYMEDKNIRLQFSSGLATTIFINGEIRRNVFLVIKEALHNVVKHSGASSVLVSMHFTNQLKVIIKDNGSGIDKENIRHFANGIENMKKRMEEIGGTVIFENDNGATITMQVPLHKNIYP